MSSSHDHAAAPEHGYGGGGRTSRPLWALIPIGLLMAVVLAMMAEGLHVMTAPTDSGTNERHVVAATGAGQGPVQGGKG